MCSHMYPVAVELGQNPQTGDEDELRSFINLSSSRLLNLSSQNATYAFHQGLPSWCRNRCIFYQEKDVNSQSGAANEETKNLLENNLRKGNLIPEKSALEDPVSTRLPVEAIWCATHLLRGLLPPSDSERARGVHTPAPSLLSFYKFVSSGRVPSTLTGHHHPIPSLAEDVFSGHCGSRCRRAGECNRSCGEIAGYGGDDPTITGSGGSARGQGRGTF